MEKIRDPIRIHIQDLLNTSQTVLPLSHLSPVYTRPLTRIRIQIKLIRVHVNALIRIVIRVT